MGEFIPLQSSILRRTQETSTAHRERGKSIVAFVAPFRTKIAIQTTCHRDPTATFVRTQI